MKTKISRILTIISILALFGIPIASSFVGCGNLDKNGIYQGDTALYESELATTTSYDLLNLFVKWEKDNRQALTKYPEVKQAADNIRVNAKQWFSTANALHDAYNLNPTPENRDKLQTALNVIRAALTEASGYMVKTATATK